jgi:sialate O-acetylesterase
MSKLLRALAVAFALLVAPLASAQPVQFASIFQDHIVLQRDRPIRLWGPAGSTRGNITVTLNGKTYDISRDKPTMWWADLPAMPAGGPYVLTVSLDGAVVQTISDVMIGDVWLCSGQSNMEFHVSQGLNMAGEIGTATDPDMRLLTVGRDTGAEPQGEFKTPVRWQAVTPQTVGDFSAACYFMARDLRQSEKVPFGLIDASWGGTPIDAWRTAASLSDDPATQGQRALMDVYRKDPAAAGRMWGERWGAWWRGWSHDAQGREPWQANPPGEWKPVPKFVNWEGWDVPAMADYNGYAWYRTEVTLTAAQAAKPATLAFGAVDDTDVAFVNGVGVGTTTSWNGLRAYPLAKGTLHAGVNHIAIAALDTGGGGGLTATADQQAIRFGDGTNAPLPDAAHWQYRAVPGPADPPHAPWENSVDFASIYNGMVAPLRDFGLRGVAWYQGEADAGTPNDYAEKLASLMKGWRTQFGDPKLPFLIVQLAGYGPRNDAPRESGFATIRDQQRKGVAADPDSALVAAFDLGEVNDIHPANKQDVGHRLARAARVIAYGGAGSASGPQAAAPVRSSGTITVDFGQPLVTYSASQPIGFELCGAAQGSCRFVVAQLSGSVVTLDIGTGPAERVRYCWGDSPICNLYGKSGLPAGPFELPVH